jgi:plastocyanin
VHPTDYFYDGVRWLYCRGAISGYDDGTFRPSNNTTRGQLTKIVVLAYGFTIYTPPTPTFRDVPTSQTFYQYIETAYHLNIISGYSCGTGCLEFRPDVTITRAQLTKIIVIAADWALVTPSAPTFRDVPASDPFYRFIETAVCHQVISGYTCGSGCLEFRPGNSATRGQISKMVYNAVLHLSCGSAPAPSQVNIQGFAFVPQNLTIGAGTTVVWTNLDSTTHTSTGSGNAWNSGNLAQGASYSHTFYTPGTYSYICAIHPSMTGTITVTSSLSQVNIDQSAFVPMSLSIHVGGAVRWTNLDEIGHTATSTTAAWDSGNLAQGDSYTHIFNAVGVYPYICTPHPWMTGTITVAL